MIQNALGILKNPEPHTYVILTLAGSRAYSLLLKLALTLNLCQFSLLLTPNSFFTSRSQAYSLLLKLTLTFIANFPCF